MTLVFKFENPKNAEHPKVGESNFKQHNPSLNHSMSWLTVAPLIRQAVEYWILPYVGEEWYDEIAKKYDTAATMTDKEKKALQLLQDAVAWYTDFEVTKAMNLSKGDMGIMQNQSKEGVASAPSQWSWKASLKNALNMGDRNLERLLNYLEKNVADFPTWKASDAYNVKTSAFIRRTETLDDVLQIKRSRRTFVAMSNWLARADREYLLGILDQTTFDNYSAKIKNGNTLTDIEKEFVRLCRDVVAFKGLYDGFDHLRISIEDTGFRVISDTDNFEDRRNAANATHLKLQEALKFDAKEKGDRACACLRAFLYANTDFFTEWAASDKFETQAKASQKTVVVSPSCRGGIGIF